jgi:hypothetical protein
MSPQSIWLLILLVLLAGEVISLWLTMARLDDRYNQLREGLVLQGRVIDYYDPTTNLEWLAMQDKDTTWDEARKWVDSLGDGWGMPTIEELKGLYREECEGTRNMPAELKTTDWKVWAGKTKGRTSAQYFYFYFPGFDDWGYRGCPDRGRGFAVRSRG